MSICSRRIFKQSQVGHASTDNDMKVKMEMKMKMISGVSCLVGLSWKYMFSRHNNGWVGLRHNNLCRYHVVTLCRPWSNGIAFCTPEGFACESPLPSSTPTLPSVSSSVGGFS